MGGIPPKKSSVNFLYKWEAMVSLRLELEETTEKKTLHKVLIGHNEHSNMTILLLLLLLLLLSLLLLLLLLLLISSEDG